MARRGPEAVKVESAGQIVVLARLNPGRSQYLMPLLSREAEKRGWRLVCRSGEALDFKPGFRIDGALVQELPDSPQVKALQQRGCALVRLGSFPHPEDSRLPAVLPDSIAWGRLAADFFHERGFRNVAYLQQAEPLIHAQPFFDVYRNRSAELGMACYPLRLVVPPAGKRTSDEKLAVFHMDRFVRMVEKLPKPCGIIFLGPGVTCHYVSWLVEHGFRVPEDVAVLGCPGPSKVFEHNIPSLSSLDDNVVRYIEAGCDLLDHLMAGGKPPTDPVFIPPLGITERESTESIGSKDSAVLKAVRYIRKNFNRNISVDDVAAEVGIGRRSLERRFSQHLGRGVNAELMRRRLQVFCEKLCATDISVEKLAGKSGFRTMSHLRQSFRLTYGMSPAQYRQQHCSKAV